MNQAAPAFLRLSVIVPSWNERDNLARLVPELVRLNQFHEIIVVDAAPDPMAGQIVRAAGGIYLSSGAPNRGAQMNLGAENATGDVLLFHHADSRLIAAHLAALRLALENPAISGGAFHRKFDARHPHLLWFESVARFLTRNGGIFFGDQSIFVRRETFFALGGFMPIALMEDIEFSRRLRRLGQVAVLDPPVESSSRRHLDRGSWRTSIENGLFILLYKCGCPPARLHRWYYRDRPATPNGTPLPQPARATQPSLGKRASLG